MYGLPVFRFDQSGAFLEVTEAELGRLMARIDLSDRCRLVDVASAVFTQMDTRYVAVACTVVWQHSGYCSVLLRYRENGQSCTCSGEERDPRSASMSAALNAVQQS